MRLQYGALLQQILLMFAMMMKYSSSVNVEQASRRLACPNPDAVVLTTFSFEYWIAVGSIGTISVNVLPTLDAYIVGQVEKKIEWCNQADLIHLMSAGAGNSATAVGSPLSGSEPATDNSSGGNQGHRDLTVVSFVHSGLEYPSNCPCTQNPVINDMNTTDMTCHVAKGTLYFASCQDNVEYLCPIIRKALEETLAMDTPFMMENDDLNFLYYYGDNYEDSFSPLELCPQPDLLTDNIGRRPPFEMDTGSETAAPSPSANATQAVEEDEITPEDANSENIDGQETATNTPPGAHDESSGCTPNGDSIQDTPPNQEEQTTGNSTESTDEERATDGQTENLDTNSSSDSPSQMPNIAPATTNESQSPEEATDVSTDVEGTTDDSTPTTTTSPTSNSGNTTEQDTSGLPNTTSSNPEDREETNGYSADETGEQNIASNETTESQNPTATEALLPTEEATDMSTDVEGTTDDSTPTTTTSPTSNSGNTTEQDTSGLPNTTSSNPEDRQEKNGDSADETGKQNDSPSTETPPVSSPGDETTGVSDDKPGETEDTDSTATSPASSSSDSTSEQETETDGLPTEANTDDATGPNANSTEASQNSVSEESPTLMPSNNNATVNMSKPINCPPGTSPTDVADASPSSDVVDQTEVQLSGSDEPSDLPSDRPSEYPSLIPSAAPIPSNRLPLNLSPATYPSVIPSRIPRTTLPSFSSAPTVSSVPTVSASPSSYSDKEGVILTGPEVGDAVTAPEEDVIVTNSEDTDNFMAVYLGVGIPILLALLVGASYFSRTRPTKVEEPLAKEVQVLSTLSNLVGTGDPPGSFHEGPFHFMADGTRYLSTRCEECRSTRQNRCFVDNYLRTIPENDIYDDTMSLSLSSESTYVNTHTTSTTAICMPISLQHKANNVHYCTSATCQKCNSNSPQKQPTTTFVSSPVWAPYPSHQGRLMPRSLLTEIENDGSFHSDADSDSVISSWDHVKVVGDKVTEKRSSSWGEGEAEV